MLSINQGWHLNNELMFYFPISIKTGNDNKDFLMLGIKLEQCNAY